MDTLTTTTQTSASIQVSENVGVDAGTSALTNARVIEISTGTGPVVSSTTSTFDDDGIASFFARPVLINTFTWPSTVASGVQIQNLDPWYLYLTTPSVVRKTSNYYKISGTLVLQVVMQAAPTQYGHAIVTLVPQGVEAYGTPYTIGNDLDALDTLPTIWQCTQDIYGDLCPATSENLEFRLPWIGTQDAIDLTALSVTGPLGGGPQTQWRFLTQVVSVLSNATNAASVGSITIRVFARVENVKLSIPYTLQMGKKGRVGHAAGMVSAAAGVLKSVPFIGEFAAGIEVVSNAVGAVADWFGFTKKTLVAVPMRVRNVVFPSMANADGDDAGAGMGLLEDNQVTIDQSLFGCDTKDVMSFDEVFRRKTLLYLVNWTTAMAAGTQLINFGISPLACHSDTNFNYYMPVGFVGVCFEYWRGPMYFEIQVRCSSLHRGMLQVVYQPNTANDTSDPTNNSYNKIFEISAEESVQTFYIGWAQNVVALRNATSDCNGYLSVRVFTILSAPDPAASVVVEIYGFSDGNMQFMSPNVPPSTLKLQSGDASEMQGAMQATINDLVGRHGEDVGDVSGIMAGERIQSIRTLLQRPFRTQTFALSSSISDASGSPWSLRWVFPNELNNLWTSRPPLLANGIAAQGWTPLTWFPYMYVGWRGSIRHKFVVDYPSTVSTTVPFSGTIVGGNVVLNGYVANMPRSSRAVSSAALQTSIPSDECGWFEWCPVLGDGVECTSPYYKPFRYSLTRLTPASVVTGPNPTITDCVALGLKAVVPGQETTFGIHYWSAGQDFSLGRFRFVPRVKYT
jgi:hypothetical protein